MDKSRNIIVFNDVENFMGYKFQLKRRMIGETETPLNTTKQLKDGAVMKLKKIFQVLERKALKGLSYANDELYKELYPKYLRKIGINIPEDYREGKSGYIDPSAYFDGSDYRMISIGKNTTISRDVIVLTHDFSIVKGLQAIGKEAKGRFLKPVKIGENCFVGARCLILPGTEIGDNTICGGGSASR